MAFHTFPTGGKPPSSPTVPAQTNAPASEEQSVPDVLVPGGATMTAISPHQAFASLTLSSEAEGPKPADIFYGELKTRLKKGEKASPAMLTEAIEAGSYKAVSLLLKKGVDPNEAMRNCSPKNLKRIIKVIDLLVEHGADINCEVSDGNTLLHHACMVGSVASVNSLIEWGANPRICKHSVTPLNLAMLCPRERQRDVLRVLARTGEDTARQMQAAAVHSDRPDVLAWMFAEGWVKPYAWTKHTNECPPELLQHLDDCFKEALKNKDEQVQKNCVVTLANIIAWRGVQTKIAEEFRAMFSAEALAMVSAAAGIEIKIDIPEKAREMLREWISIAPDMMGPFLECAEEIGPARNPVVAVLEDRLTQKFLDAIEAKDCQAAATCVEELTTRLPDSHEVAVILVKWDRICLDQFWDHDTLQIRDQIEKGLRNYRDKVMLDPHPAVIDYFYRKMYNDELTRITAAALYGDQV